MEGILIQDWTTIRSGGATGSVYQTEEDWLDVDPYGDLVLWTEASQVLLGGGTSIWIDIETAPTKDAALFSVMASIQLAAAAGPTITKVIDGVASVLPQVWVRWKLYPMGLPPGEWGATFRIYCAANRRRRA